jgi:hypothetical protein
MADRATLDPLQKIGGRFSSGGAKVIARDRLVEIGTGLFSCCLRWTRLDEQSQAKQAQNPEGGPSMYVGRFPHAKESCEARNFSPSSYSELAQKSPAMSRRAFSLVDVGLSFLAGVVDVDRFELGEELDTLGTHFTGAHPGGLDATKGELRFTAHGR